MNKDVVEKIAKSCIEKDIPPNDLIELYGTIAGMAKIIDTLFGCVGDEKEVIDAYNNEPYKEYVFKLIEQKYGEGGYEFFKFAVAYEIGRRSVVTT